jgi:hypothetical protein
MVPDGERARCPRCGGSQLARRAPVFVITGASGSGKTTVFAPLVDALASDAVLVFDVDWLIDPLAALAGDAGMGEPHWVALRDAWLCVAHGVAQANRATVLLGPFIPEHLERLPARQWISEVHFGVLDCADDERRRRLAVSRGWRDPKIDDHIRFAAWLRANVGPVFRTDEASPAEVAGALAAWVRGVSASAADRADLSDQP